MPPVSKARFEQLLKHAKIDKTLLDDVYPDVAVAPANALMVDFAPCQHPP